MHSHSYRILFVALLLHAFVGSAQNFGGFPPATQWRQINTDTARIIFSPGAQRQALRIAQLVHAMAKDTPMAIGKTLKKIPVVLHNYTTQANGYVALGPFRSEYYLIPGADIFEFGNLPWHENLAVHEYRHVQQYNNFNNGLTKLFSILGGQNGRALANALTIPDWFFEGDAVYAETAFTDLGRGRQPLFLSAYNSLWQEGKNYSWMKLRNGSYKDYVPNHYPLGYLLVNYGYYKYGPAFWHNVTADATGFKGLFYPFQRAVKKYSNGDFKKFRAEALLFYKKDIAKQPVLSNDKAVTNYYFPQAIGNDSLLYLKESYRTLPAFYVKDSRGEHRIKLRAITTENWFQYRDGKIVYTAFSRDKRWSLIDFSDVIMLDIQTGNETRVTKKGRYYTPDLAPGAKFLIAVSINDSLHTALHLLDARTGALVKTFTSGNGDYFVHPKFINAEHIVVGVRSLEGLLSLRKINIINGSSEILIAPQKAAIGDPSIFENKVFFTASFSGNDELYAYRLDDKKLYQLTSGQTGNYNATVLHDTLVWSQFTTMGLQLKREALKNLLWQQIDLQAPNKQKVLFPVAMERPDFLNAESRSFEIKRYSKSNGLVNLHSWDPGLNLYSNNILNTLAASAYYRYNEAEKSHTTGFAATYGGFFPVLTATVENTIARHIKTGDSTITANSSEAGFGYNLPLNFSHGKTVKVLNLGSSYVYNAFRPTGASKNTLAKTGSDYLHHFISWTQQLQRARQHIYPKFGYTAALHFRHLLGDWGYQKLAGATIYLPAFSKTHSLVFSGAVQQVDTNNVLFSNRFSLARGYTDYYYSRMWTAGINYHVPLWYPDWGVANLIYFLRVRSNFFFDYSQVYSNNKQAHAPLRSVGTELYFDTKWWNQLPVTFGVRYSCLLDKKFVTSNRHVFEFIVPVDLFPF